MYAKITESFCAVIILCVGVGCENGEREVEVGTFAELDASGPIAFSDDGEIVATVSNGSYHDDNSSIVEIRDAQTTYPTGTMIRTSSRVREIEFVTNDFGFLLACSSRYPIASEENSERPVSSLEQLCLSGKRKVVVARIVDVISSMAVSSDHQMVTVCTRPRAYAVENAHCYVFSLPDGREIARFSPEKVKRMVGVFVGDANNIFLWAGETGHRAVGYLVEARSGQILQQCDVSEGEIEVNSIVAPAASDDVFVSTAGSVYRVNAGMKGI
ncbi:MAG: hypothetical protein JNM43_10495, partial [Planctomycetaceae bacterium]|nr:hypothetical protein [Planctomycetaceae bacterium]